MSAGLADLRIGATAWTYSRTVSQSSVHGVSTRPGAMELTRTSGPSTAASRPLRWFSAAFEHAYGIELPVGRKPASEVMVTIEPSCSRRAGTAARHISHVPKTLV